MLILISIDCMFACLFCIAHKSSIFSKLHVGPFLALLRAYLLINIAFCHPLHVALLHYILHAFTLLHCILPCFCTQAPAFILIAHRSLHLHSCMHSTPISSHIAPLHTFEHPQLHCTQDTLHCTHLGTFCTQTPTQITFAGP